MNITLATLAPGASCTLNIDVTGTTLGPKINTATVTSTNAGPGTPAVATLTVATLPPTLTKAFAPAMIPVGGTSTLTVTLTNPNLVTPLSGVGFVDILPAGLFVSTSGLPVTTCPGGVVTAAPGGNSITLSGGTLATSASCTVMVVVTGNSAGLFANSAAPAAAESGAGVAGTASLILIQAPTLRKTFNPTSVSGNGTARLTFVISNSNVVPITGLSLSDSFPQAIVISNNPGLNNTCGGTITPPVLPGAGSIALTGGTLAAGASCEVSVSVTIGSEAFNKLCNTAVSSSDAGLSSSATACISVLPEEAYQVGYAANLDKGDSVVNLTNAGTHSGTDPQGRICVNVYAFDPAEEMISCCACLVTPNGLQGLSVNRDIIGNTLTPGRPTSITIKLLASTPIGGTCNASSPTAANLVRGMRAWGTTIHAMPTGSIPPWGITEIPFARSELSASELSKLTSYCGFTQTVGSGFGICRSCQPGALGGDAKQ